MHLYVTASRDTTSFIPIYFHNDSFLCKTKKCNSHHKKYKLNEFRDWWLLWCLFRLPLYLKRWQKTNKKNIFVEKITDTFENLCCNIRNVKSNYLKCIALKCLSPPWVLQVTGQKAKRASEQNSGYVGFVWRSNMAAVSFDKKVVWTQE